jgi:hypothetical protein
MAITKQIAKHVRDFHFGGNYTGVNLKLTLHDVTWQEATTKYKTLNTIAALVFHINYYIDAVLNVLQGAALNAHDQDSYSHPSIGSEQDWHSLLYKVFSDAEQFAQIIENLEDDKLDENFLDGKYGSYFRNLEGAIEHGNYHLGQISLIKKILRS